MERDERRVEKRMEKRTRIILSVLLAAVILGGILLCACSGDTGKNEKAGSGEAETTGQAEEKAEDAGAAETGPRAVILFASDYQAGGHPLPDEVFASLMRSAKEDGKEVTNVIMCGDYSNVEGYSDHQIAPDGYIEEIRGLIADNLSGVPQEDIIFVQGNHDAMSDAVSASGLHEYDDYLVYVLNTESDFPWCQGDGPETKDTVMRAARELEDCLGGLAAKGETRPVFIAGHVPLHFTARTSSLHTTGDNMYSKYIFDAVNGAAKSLDIFYLFGHDHSNAWDSYLGGSCVYRAAGDSVLIPAEGASTEYTDDYSEEKLNFTYLNAGFTGYYYPGNTEADDTLTCITAEIYGDRVVLTRYDSEGRHPLGSAGCEGPGRELIGPEHYSAETAGPVTIKRNHASKSGTIREDKSAVQHEDGKEKDAA